VARRQTGSAPLEKRRILSFADYDRQMNLQGTRSAGLRTNRRREQRKKGTGNEAVGTRGTVSTRGRNPRFLLLKEGLPTGPGRARPGTPRRGALGSKSATRARAGREGAAFSHDSPCSDQLGRDCARCAGWLPGTARRLKRRRQGSCRFSPATRPVRTCGPPRRWSRLQPSRAYP
jgi:hypothetical protein